MTATGLTRDKITPRNVAAVENHFHDENPERIRQALELYTDDITWKVPRARHSPPRQRGWRNCPYPIGTKVSMRFIELRDGKICRENGYEIWRRADDSHLIDDDA